MNDGLRVEAESDALPPGCLSTGLLDEVQAEQYCRETTWCVVCCDAYYSANETEVKVMVVVVVYS